MARPTFERFVIRAIDHVRRNFPELAATLGDGEIERSVRGTLARAGGHRLETERDLLRYVNVAFVFGSAFDVDPALPWAAEILAGNESAPIRTARLITAALRHESEARGLRASDPDAR